MKFSREFYFCAFFFHATAKKFTRLKHPECWYLVREKYVFLESRNFIYIFVAQFYFRAFLVARITLFRADYIFAQEHRAKIKLT